MMKFSERSKRGQRRIMICAASVIAVLLIAFVLIFDKSGFKEIGTLVRPTEGVTSTPSVTATPGVPTEVPEITGSVEPSAAPTQKPGGLEPGDDIVSATDVFNSITKYILEPEYRYGTMVDGIQINESILNELAGIKTYGKKISVKEVSVGDIGFYGDSVCVCVCVDENGRAVFAYANPFESSFLPNGGIYLGYSLEQYDAMFYGMYPVPCDRYYDCADGVINTVQILQKAERYYETCSPYADALFGVGRMFSEKKASDIKSLVPEDLMREQNVKFEDGSVEEFLDRFASCAGADYLQDKDFCFIEKKIFELSSGIYLKVSLLNLTADNFLSEDGRWEVSVGDSRIIPYPGYKLSDCTGYGFVRAKETVYHYDEDGNLTGYEYVDVVNREGTIIENEDGSRTYIGNGFSAELNEEQEFLTYDEPIVDLGNGQYLLRDKNGQYHSRDLSRYGELPPEVMEQILNKELQTVNGDIE